MSSGGSPRVLIVEDNPGDVFLFQEVLRQRQVGIDLLVASEVDDGIRLLAPEQGPAPCLALIDLHLPKRDGKHLLVYLRAQAHLSKMAAVVLSSSQRPAEREACLKLGAREVLVKPSDWSGYCSLVTDLTHYWSQPA